MIFPAPRIICLTPFFKLLPLLVTLTGAVLGYISNIFRVLSLYSFISFTGTMWHLPYLSVFGSSPVFLKAGLLVHHVNDSGWAEY